MDKVCPFCARYYKFEEAVQNYGLCLHCDREIPPAVREARKLGILDAPEDEYADEFEDDDLGTTLEDY